MKRQWDIEEEVGLYSEKYTGLSREQQHGG